jgi:hypothetical protein
VAHQDARGATSSRVVCGECRNRRRRSTSRSIGCHLVLLARN